MTSVTIDLPDDQAAALKAKAAALGLSLEGWFKKMAEQETPPGKKHYSLSALMQLCDLQAPLSPEDREWMDAPDVGREAP